ncbi:hypothetical protein X915_gp176 [Bacillus phage vB_BanS-Tsamsa]|uniref:Uncharacterized protein n=1 Tax=Bacillus phage vB_BanS-Tsamsa TaxID=1308863 RepID=U5JA01_9CAUD|nr:hypothetical protein X915_gp176 [Bacillus phage vB_BanS-Tsamsa]AGI11945.1 hypothetical protein [Bacillus phage vB_BanS-Tsamsa]
MKVEFEFVDGEVYVVVYQEIWDLEDGQDKFVVHREKVSETVAVMANKYHAFQFNKILIENSWKK